MTLDGRPIDCVTEGDLVPAGRKVKILAVEGARVVVRPVEESEKT
jgi:membrane-bound ClpP family serine protease